MFNSMIQHIEFKPKGTYSSLGMVFDVEVDHTSLLHYLTEYEGRFSSSINGAYTAALGVHDLVNNMTSHLARFMPYACDCGEPECWFITVQIDVVDDYICWKNWSNPYRNDKSKDEQGDYWCYRDFPVLCFDRQQYNQAIANAIQLIQL